jgi:acetyl-CoA acetyltransferase
MLRFGRFPDRTIDDMGAEAALLALKDAGLSMADVQALYCGNIGEGAYMVGQRILQQIGQTGIPVVNCQNACATGATAFREGWIAIKAGLYDVVLAVGVEQMGKGMLGRIPMPNGIPVEGVVGSGSMPAVFSQVGMEHSRKYGTTFEQFAKVSVKNHHHSTFNPKAMYGNAAGASDGRGDDRLSEHQADVLGECGRSGGGRAGVREEGEGARARPRGSRQGFGARIGPLHPARPRHAGFQ